MYINRQSPIPAYYQLRNIILKKIELGEFAIDTPIPSERDLSEIMNLSRMTVRQALNQLVSDGVLYRERGKGTFVAKPKIEQRNIMSFSDTVKKKGFEPSTKVLHFSKNPATQEIKQILELKDNEKVYNIKRLRLANDIPIAIEEVFIPEKYCPNLDNYDLTLSLYKLMREEFMYNISYVDNIIESSKPLKDEINLLNIKTGISVLRTAGINYIESGIKLFYENSAYRSDEYKYSVRIYVNKDIE